MRSDEGLIVAIGSPLLPDDSAALSQYGSQVANVSELGSLPRDWWGYEGVDTVILMSGADEASAKFAAAPEQLAALDQWVRMGGRLILSVGRGAAELLAPGGPLAALVPGKFEGTLPLRQSTVLETYAETSEPLNPGVPILLNVPKLLEVSGRIEAYAGNHPRDLPLVVRSPRGFGEVVFVAFDLEAAPFSTWAARPQLLARLLGKPLVRDTQSESQSLGQVTTLGFEDLSGQLRGALDQYAEVQVVPFWLVALLLLAYIACIGPLDYFLVRRVFGRMELTWLTFALWVAGFSAGGYALAYGLKGASCGSTRLTWSTSTCRAAWFAAPPGPPCSVRASRPTIFRSRPPGSLARRRRPARPIVSPASCFRGSVCPARALAVWTPSRGPRRCSPSPTIFRAAWML